jgi:hypothetical protein
MSSIEPGLRISSTAFSLALVVSLGSAQAQDKPALAYAIVDTQQSTCYDAQGRSGCPAIGAALAGQDAAYRGHQPQYRDNGDGTISDLVSGLMWEKGYHRTTWSDAPAQAAAQRTGGYSDWRVPTTKELYSLIDFNGRTGSMGPPTAGGGGRDMASVPANARPYLDQSVFDFQYPSENRYIDAQYVASTTYSSTVMGGQRAFFGVNFADGRIKGYPQSGGPGHRQWYARYVRGNPAYGQNDFQDQGNGTILDRATGLTWSKGDSGDTAYRPQRDQTQYRDGRLDWPEALAFCEGLTYGGASDWRLPNAKELHSLLDYQRSPDATDSPALSPLFSATAIRDPDGRRDWPYYWTSTSHLDGRTPGSYAVYIAFGRAQGYMAARGQASGPGSNRPPPMGGPPPIGGRPGFPPGPGPSRSGPGGAGGGDPMAITATDGMTLMDVHGAGAQRSSPKTGDESRLPKGHGPQGDILRIYNYVRCVRGGLS